MTDQFPAEGFDDRAENHDQFGPGGNLIMADIAFENQAALETVRRCAGEAWEDEFYWLADETIPALAEAGLHAKYHRVSSCAGVFEITR